MKRLNFEFFDEFKALDNLCIDLFGEWSVRRDPEISGGGLQEAYRVQPWGVCPYYACRLYPH